MAAGVDDCKCPAHYMSVRDEDVGEGYEEIFGVSIGDDRRPVLGLVIEIVERMCI
jgi:hypothetical protein